MLPPMSTSASQTLGGAARTVLALLVLCTGSCAYGELRHVLRAQVASETDCPEVSVVKSPPYLPGYKEHQYVVKGCGVDRIYNCSEGGLTKYGHAECTYVDSAAAARAAQPAPSPSLDEPLEPSGLDEPTPSEPGPSGGSTDDEADKL
jgi:hypothetical protein